MLVRATLVAVTAVVLLPFAGGTAHASCLDDATARPIDYGYSESPRSGRWPLYVEQSGTATFTVYGDALVADYTAFATVDMPNYAQIVAGNAVTTTTTFVDCVAG